MTRNSESGVALVVTIMAMGLLLALGGALLLITMTETGISANHRDGIEALYGAEAGIERALPDLAAALDWDAVLAGSVLSTFVDGPPAGTRQIAGGPTIDLTALTNTLRCGVASACSPAAMDAMTAERPWGRNNPRWQLYAYGPLAGMLPPGRFDSSVYVTVWVGDDPSENDADPFRDGQPPAIVDALNPDNPGRGLISLVAHAYEPGGSRRVLQATVSRASPVPVTGSAKMRILAWGEIR